MKKLILILLIFAGCKVVIPYGDVFLVSDWEKYKIECYKDSTMQVIELKSGELINGEIKFDLDTVWIHKKPDWNEFIEKQN